jgi:hypothetical protein
MNKWERRDRKRHKARHGMRVDNAGVRRVQMDLARKRQRRRKK